MNEFERVRTEGIGTNFSVLNPADGFRKDNRLWFGKCSECGETVTNSIFDDGWQHRIHTYLLYYSKNGVRNDYPNGSSSYQVDYCPKAAGETHEPRIEVKELA